MKIVFFGTPVFAADILQRLIDSSVDVAAVVTKPDRAKGRTAVPQPSAVKQLVVRYLPHIPLYQPEKISTPEYAALLARHRADLFVVVAFGEIIKQSLLDIPKLGCINVHASLLPKYRGAAPIQRCLMNGETESGITLMYMAKQLDAGDIIKKVSCPIDENMTAGELEQRLCHMGGEALLEVLADLSQNRIFRTPQNESEATFAPKVELEDGEVVWNKPARQIHNLIRGLSPRPGAWCYATVKGERKRLKLIGSSLLRGMAGSPGNIVDVTKEGVVVACGEGALLISRLQLEGKREMAAGELLRGVKITLNHGFC